MNKIVKGILCLALVFSVSSGAFAQGPRPARGSENRKEQKEQKANWQEKFRAEKVAYLTSELDLTAAEAEKFWPVYNQIEKERFAAMKNRALKDALIDGKGEKEIGNLTEAYVRSNDSVQFDLDAFERVKKVLPAEKAAKLVLAEEKFRNQQFHRLKGDDGRVNRPQTGENTPKGNNKARKASSDE